jgi:hypothetical protein
MPSSYPSGADRRGLCYLGRWSRNPASHLAAAASYIRVAAEQLVMALMSKKGSHSKANSVNGLPVLVRDLALLLVWLDENAGVADEVRVAFGQDELHRLWVDEGDEAEHALLLVRDAHVVDGAVDADFSVHRTREPASEDCS